MAIYMKRLLMLAFVFLFISLMVWRTKFFDEKAIQNFHLFNQSDIEGILSYVSGSSTGVHITVNDSRFTFLPIETKIRGERKFYRWASPGDSIVKPAYSDILILHKIDRAYHYEFRKYED